MLAIWKLCQKKAQNKQLYSGGIISENATEYRVDGEVGRFTFKTHKVSVNNVAIFNTAADIFRPICSREQYRTEGFNEIAMYLSTCSSYRKASELFNRIRWQQEDGTPTRTLASVVEYEGIKIQTAIEHIADKALHDNQFTKEGLPQNSKIEYGLSKKQAGLSSETLSVAIENYNYNKDATRQINLTEAQQFYENPAVAVNVSIDDVGVKKQKETGRSTAKVKKESREYIHNTIAHVEHGGKSYILNGSSNEQVLRLLIALLLCNSLLTTSHLQFFVDGARSLHNSILKMFQWLPSFRIILDWYHLHEKCKIELSLAMKGSKIRNSILEQLLPILWLGQVDAAIEFLRSINNDQLKPGQSVERLVGYFERNREHIPCYALRKKLGLRNSSNKGEKANDLSVASRQKHNGMSWSKIGSGALTTVTVLHLNNEQKNWYQNDQVIFHLVA